VPYNVKIEGNVSGQGRHRHRDFAMATGEMDYDGFVDFLTAAVAAAKPHLIDGALALLFIDWRHVGEMLEAGRRSSFEHKNILVWAKDNAGLGSLWRSQHELIVAFKHGDASHVNNVQLGVHGRHRSNLLQYPGMNSLTKGRSKALKLHATVKPVALIADLILDVTNRGDFVLDPFGGSGTAIIAAEKTGRRALLCEIDPGFVDVSVARWEALTGQPARLNATQQTFAEVRAERMEARHG
jgi:DNA modification methylase